MPGASFGRMMRPKILRSIIPIVKDFITEEGRAAIEKARPWGFRKDGDKARHDW